MMEVRTDGDTLRIGELFSISFQRTLRIPDDGKTFPLPPDLGNFPIFHVADYSDRVPREWVKQGGVFIPMYQREALWLSFFTTYWKPNAVKIGVGKINAISGKIWDQRLTESKQDYVVCPEQPWLDGINAGNGYVKQFVAMPLGMGYTVEGQITGEETFGGIQIIVYEPKPGRFPDEPRIFGSTIDSYCAPEMGLAAGGRMRQRIYPDHYGLETWDQDNYGRAYIHIVNSMNFREITGLEPPGTPVSAKMYTSYGYPWFDLYDENKGDIEASGKFKKVKSVKEMDKKKGFKPQQDDESVDISPDKIIKLGKESKRVNAGKW